MAFGNLTYTGPLPSREIEKLLFENIGLQPRQLPASDIMLARQKQIIGLIQHWDPVLESEILADNFYLDKSRDHRMAEIKALLGKAGALQGMEEIQVQNQLRGGFKLNTENGSIDVFFTLSPESDPKVQFLHLSFREE